MEFNVIIFITTVCKKISKCCRLGWLYQSLWLMSIASYGWHNAPLPSPICSAPPSPTHLILCNILLHNTQLPQQLKENIPDFTNKAVTKSVGIFVWCILFLTSIMILPNVTNCWGQTVSFQESWLFSPLPDGAAATAGARSASSASCWTWGRARCGAGAWWPSATPASTPATSSQSAGTPTPRWQAVQCPTENYWASDILCLCCDDTLLDRKETVLMNKTFSDWLRASVTITTHKLATWIHTLFGNMFLILLLEDCLEDALLIAFLWSLGINLHLMITPL